MTYVMLLSWLVSWAVRTIIVVNVALHVAHSAWRCTMISSRQTTQITSTMSTTTELGKLRAQIGIHLVMTKVSIPCWSAVADSVSCSSGWVHYAAMFDPNAPIQVSFHTPLGTCTKKADTSTRLKLVLRPDKLEKAGLDAKTTAAKVKSFETATITEWKKHKGEGDKPNPGRPALENVKVAVMMLCQEEALHWTENRRFIEAAFARAAVVEADEYLVHQLTKDATTTSVNHFTLHQKLQIYIKAVDAHERDKPSRRTKFPNLALNGAGRSEPSI